MTSAIIFAASYLLWIMAAGLGVLWLFGERGRGKIRVVLAALTGLAVVGVFIIVASHLHTDPRPFVQNPRLHPLISHAADNGFPSDHSSAAGLIAALAVWRNRLWGALLSAGAVGVAAGRVAAHVHHIQDVAAGLTLGILAAAAGIGIAALLMRRLAGRVGRGRRGRLVEPMA